MEHPDDIVCQKFLDNPEINPRTGRSIKEGKITYNDLVKLCVERKFNIDKLSSKSSIPIKSQNLKSVNNVSNILKSYRSYVSEVIIPYSNQEFGRNINFNPGMIHLYDNTFLVAFHTYRRLYGHPYNVIPEPNIKDPYHMWYGGPNSSTWWEYVEPSGPGSGGFKGTGFMIIKIDLHKIYLYQVFDVQTTGSDTRLSIIDTYNEGKYKVISDIFSSFTSSWDESLYNIWGIDREKYGLTKANPTGERVSINEGKLHLINHSGYRKSISGIKARINEHFELSLEYKGKGTSVCPKLQRRDKNWSFFRINDKIYTSYWLSPKHTVFDTKICNVHMEQNTNIFYRIEQYYEKKILFSLSTPAIEHDGKMIAVGHVKVNYSLPINTTGYYFLENMKLSKHPVTAYMMFFYTFDKNTFEIIEISSAFYPPEMANNVVFAVGLVKFNDEFIISYGEGDCKMKFLFMPYNEINELLMDQNLISEEYEFIYL